MRIINRSVNLNLQPAERLVYPVADGHELYGIAEQFHYCVIHFASVRTIAVAFTWHNDYELPISTCISECVYMLQLPIKHRGYSYHPFL